jgi:hypothetical protein
LQLSFFVTRKGYIGVGHPNIAVGDTIAVLLGGPVPYILRKYNDAYVLVGEWYVSHPIAFCLADVAWRIADEAHDVLTQGISSYVHGIMDGELIKKRKEEDAKRGAKEKEGFTRFNII